MKKNSSRLLYLISAIVTFSVTLAIAFILIAESTEANRYILNKVSELVPGIHFKNVSGSIAHDLHLNFTYQDKSLSIQADDLRINLNVSCIWQLSLCIENLHTQSLIVSIHNSDSPPKDITLPDIQIPFLFRLQSLKINQFQFFQDKDNLYSAHNIQATAYWFGSKISLKKWVMEDAFCHWNTAGAIQLHDHYPISATVNCEASMPDIKHISTDVSGDLQQLQLTATTMGKANAKLNITLNALVADFPLAIQAKLEKPYSLSLTTPATIKQFELHADGNIQALHITADGQINTDYFSGDIHPTLDATLSSNNALIHSLTLLLPEGKIKTSGNFHFTPELRWKGNSILEHINIDMLHSDIHSDIDGILSHSVTFQDNKINANLNINKLEGSLLRKPFSATGNADLQGTKLTLQNIQITQENNLAAIKGSIDSNNTGKNNNTNLAINLDLQQLNTLHNSASGSLSGNVKLMGNINQPIVSSNLTGNNIAFDSFHSKQITLTTNLNPQTTAQNEIDLFLTKASINNQLMSDLKLSLAGSLNSHQIVAHWEENLQPTEDKLHPPSQLTLHCEGQFPNKNPGQLLDHWQVQCKDTHAEFVTNKLHWKWQQEAPLKADIKNGNAITLSPFCLTSNQAKFCNEKTIQYENGNLIDTQITARKIKLELLQPWLPEKTILTGHVNADITAAIQNGQFKSQLHAQSTNTLFSIAQSGQANFELPFSNLSFDAELTPETKQVRWKTQSSLAGETTGSIQTQQNSIKADITIQSVDISAFSEFISSEDDERIAGIINGHIAADGTFSEPNLSGDIYLKHGEIQLDVLPLPIDKINIHLRAKQNKAVMKGRFFVAEKEGSLVGRFKEEGGNWNTKLKLHSETIVISPSENINISITPDIRFDITPTSMALRGNIHVPKARIFIKSLPEQAISISPDAKIVGRDPTHATLDIFSDLKLTLGDDVKFRGFGLETNLTGNLNLHQNGSDMIRTKGIVRLEDGTYQAYGQNLVIDEGDLIFIDDIENPQLRLSATRAKIKDSVIVGIMVSGRAKSPNIRLFSTPDMSQQEKLHYLLTGRAPNSEGGNSQSIAAETALAMALSRNNKIGKKASNALGIEDFSISAGSTDDVSEVELSGYITPDLMIRYGVGMFESVNSLTLSYRIKENLFLEVLSGKNSALDLLWSFDLD